MTTARRRIRHAQLPKGCPVSTLAQGGVLQSTFREGTSGFGLDREMPLVKIFTVFPFPSRYHIYVIMKSIWLITTKASVQHQDSLA